MVDIHSVAAEIRRRKKDRKIDRKKLQGKNIMAPLLHRAAIKIGAKRGAKLPRTRYRRHKGLKLGDGVSCHHADNLRVRERVVRSPAKSGAPQSPAENEFDVYLVCQLGAARSRDFLLKFLAQLQ